MIYLIDGRQFDLDYSQLQELYVEFCSLTDEQFLAVVPQLLHFCCIVSYFKNHSAQNVLGDSGVIHELAHLNAGIDTVLPLTELREQFEVWYKLS